jgi:hypothetical protein
MTLHAPSGEIPALTGGSSPPLVMIRINSESADTGHNDRIDVSFHIQATEIAGDQWLLISSRGTHLYLPGYRGQMTGVVWDVFSQLI